MEVKEISGFITPALILALIIQFIRIGKAFSRHESRHALIAGYILQLCEKAGIKVKEDGL